MLLHIICFSLPFWVKCKQTLTEEEAANVHSFWTVSFSKLIVIDLHRKAYAQIGLSMDTPMRGQMAIEFNEILGAHQS